MSTTYNWSPQQAQAIDKVTSWLKAKNRPQVFHLFGYAGSGKTTLALAIADIAREILDAPVDFASFTGKAALVMRSKGCIGASTIHSLIYINTAPKGAPPVWEINENSDLYESGLLIVDECSMLGQDLGWDLLSFETPILVLGDPYQLPPIHGTGFFDVPHPEIMLTEIHRQAQDNPIIRLSMDIREGKKLSPGMLGQSWIGPKSQISKDTVANAGQIIVGLNRTRRAYNDRVRRFRGITSSKPVPGEKLICLKNNSKKGLLNGSTWEVLDLVEKGLAYEMEVRSLDDERETTVNVPVAFFNGSEDTLPLDYRIRHDEFTYGYVITCHKSQGSQWDEVVLFNESIAFKENRSRWLYTGVTRAAKTIHICI